MNSNAALALYGAPVAVLLAAVLMAWRNHVVMRRAHRENGFTDAAPLEGGGIAAQAYEAARSGTISTPASQRR